MNAVLIVPACEKGRGGGHLVRSAVAVRSLRSGGTEAFLFLNERKNLETLETLEKIDPAWITDNAETRAWEYIVLDRFQTPPEEFAFWSALAPVIGIDEGGTQRDQFDFLIDLLPLLPEVCSPPNLLAPHLLPLPKNRRESFFRTRKKDSLKILVSFGAEDPGGLTIPACAALTALEGAEVTALFGGLNRQSEHPTGVTVLEKIPELREHLAEYDLVITHFGLTAFECLSARVPVILMAPSEYHEKLAVHAGFVTAKNAEQLSEQASRYTALGEASEKIATRYGLAEKTEPSADKETGIENKKTGIGNSETSIGNSETSIENKENSIGTLLARYKPHVPQKCPVCASPQRETIARFPERTYRRCSACGMVYMLRSTPPPIEYEREYFFDFYKKQYGKTYLEDFPNLMRNGKARLKHIKAVLRPQSPSGLRLLDIGCAYGPFLAAALDEGFTPAGIDPAEDAAAYVRNELNIPAFRGFFPDTPLPEGFSEAASFDVISLWYVIEHFENPSAALKEIHRLLKPGGVLAFSTPSFSGVSGRTSPTGFLEKSPPDHWTVWNPRTVAAVLKPWGFTLKRIAVSGHHPERFPTVGTLLNRRRGLAYRIGIGISRLFGLGDTFEAYAVKDPHKHE